MATRPTQHSATRATHGSSSIAALEQVTTRYYDREALKAGNRLDGPAIVNQYDTTTVIPPGVGGVVDRYGNIVIEVGASAQAMAIAATASVSTSQGV